MAKSALKNPDIFIPLILLIAAVVGLIIYMRALKRSMPPSIGKKGNASDEPQTITYKDKSGKEQTYTFLTDDQLKDLTTINV